MNLARFSAFLHDVAVAALAWILAFWLRFNLDIPIEYREVMLVRLPFEAAIYAVAFLGFGLYRGLWRFASLPDLQRILLAAGLGALAVPAFFAIVRAGLEVPRSVYLLTPLLIVAMMGGSRFAYRAWKEGHLGAVFAKPNAVPVLVLGASRAAVMLLKDLAANPHWRVVGVLDDDTRKQGAEIIGEKVLGPIAEVGKIAKHLGVKQAILAMPGATHTVRKRVLDLCARSEIAVMTVPAISDIVSGKVSVSALRPVELDDLLGRDPVQLDDAGLHEFITGRTVLVTGAGGSIGSELCRQIARLSPARLVLFESSEYALYQIEQELRDTGVAAAEADSRHRWWTLFAMCFALFMIMLDNTVVNVALPSIQRDLNVSPDNLEWTVNGYVLAFAVLILLGGKLGDRFGRKRMFLVGLAIFTLSSAACALASTDGQLIGFRVVQGVGAALMNPLSLSIIVNAFPRQQIPTAIGIWAGISALGLAIGPLLGGFLVETFSWSYVFWINVPIGVIAAGATLWAVVESRDPTAKHLDIVGTVLITGGLFSLIWALIETHTHSWGSTYTIAWLVLSAVLLALFVAWESRQSDPMIPLDFFSHRAFSVSAIVVTLVGFALFGVIYFLTLYFQNVQQLSAFDAGLRTLPMTASVMVVAPIAGRFNARIGPRPLMTIGMGLASLGLLGLTQLSVDSSYWTIFPSFLAMGAGLAMTMPTTASTAMGAVSGDKAGIASGVVNASRQVGGALGIAVLGAVGAAVASSAWSDKVSALSPQLQAQAARVEDLVIGGQAALVGRLGGSAAQQAAAESFVQGVDRAMWVGAGITLCASIIAFFGLAGVHVRSQQAAQQQPPPQVAIEA